MSRMSGHGGVLVLVVVLLLAARSVRGRARTALRTAWRRVREVASTGVGRRVRRLRGRASGAPSGGPVEVPPTRFADVAGCPEAVADLAEVVAFLGAPGRLATTGARMPRGYLLAGPPGTGKTLLARAVAGEAGVPFFATSGADFNDTFIGMGRKRVRSLFARARRAAARHGGAVVFLDEVDALGGRRADCRRDSASDDHDATLVALLTELDGFDPRAGAGIVVLAATNRPDALDPALTRPGRFDRTVAVTAPDPRGRAAILRLHLARVPSAPDVDADLLGRRTPGLVGADLEGLVNEAALEAARRGLPAADADCFDEALATTAMGRARTGAVVSDRDRRITAWHEAGHTVLALLEPDADDPVSVSITPRGPAGGVTWMSGTDDAFLTREEAQARLAVCLGGRAAEEVLLGGSFSQGASGDLAAATDLATAMATRYGMTRLGLAVRRARADGGADAEVLAVVEDLLGAALVRARAVLAEHGELLAAVARELLEHETLDRTALRRIADRRDLALLATLH